MVTLCNGDDARAQTHQNGGSLCGAAPSSLSANEYEVQVGDLDLLFLLECLDRALFWRHPQGSVQPDDLPV